MPHPIARALISVSDKTGLVPFVKALSEMGVDIISTGGTAKLLMDHGIAITEMGDYTGFPEMLDGRVKTLHPKVHGGLLAVRDNKTHMQALETHHIPTIDMVVVNLYPFEATVARGADYDTCVENIDIGGPSMVRSAAKNHAFVTLVTDPSDYDPIIEHMKQHQGTTDLPLRKSLAAKAFRLTASYDAAISQWFAEQEDTLFPERITFTASRFDELRYGENPDQRAAVYAQNPSPLIGIPQAEQLQGKALSYNNIHDADAALSIVSDFIAPSVVFVKHANPCGMASGQTIEQAYDLALACDPVSAFGGIVALNRPLTKSVAQKMTEMFLEVIIAPAIDEEAAAVLASKKNVRLLITHQTPEQIMHYPRYTLKSIRGGFLIQEPNRVNITDQEGLQVVTKRAPTEEEWQDLLFAFTVCKHVKSNAIVLAHNQATIGIGAGQMSRVDSVRIACMKASDGNNAARLKQGVIASDAFFPFPDGLLYAANAGIRAAIQPGGSIRDEEVIEAANAHDMAMVFTGKRHFLH